MEEAIECLRAVAVDVPAPISLPDDDDLISVEEELLIPLPYDLRMFLLQVSDVVYGTLEPVTVTDPYAHTHLPEVAAQAWDAYVPRHLLPVCQTYDGYYCIAEDGEITLWTLEGQSDETWPSIWQWIRDVWLES